LHALGDVVEFRQDLFGNLTVFEAVIKFQIRTSHGSQVQDLRRHFEPWRVVSEKISRDEKTGVSKEVGFARRRPW
jgi:hypothetical protein